MIPDNTPRGASEKNLVVLLADDAADVRMTVQRWLEEAGHSVIAVASGNEGLRVIRHQAVDVLVTEVIMPNGDGLELITQTAKLRSSVRAIAMSGGGRYLPAADCLRVAKGLGAHATVMKPLVRDHLLEVVRQVTADVAVRC